MAVSTNCRHGLLREWCHQCSPATAGLVLSGAEASARDLMARKTFSKSPKPSFARAKAPLKSESGADAILRAMRCEVHPLAKSGLVVVAWKAAPKLFGLAAYEDLYPDSNKVLSYIYGRRGLIARGKVVRVEGGRFQVAEVATCPA
jgi:hypothetical protein